MSTIRLLGILRLLGTVYFLLASFCSFAQTNAGTGYIESAQWDARTHELTIIGWAGTDKVSVFTTNLIVRLADQEVYRGRIERLERPDVVKHTGRSDWLSSGFSIRISLPNAISGGTLPLTARMRLGDGNEFELGIAPSAQFLSIPPAFGEVSILARLGLFLAVVCPLMVLAWPRRAASQQNENDFGLEKIFGCAIVFSFFLLVSAGWTGSSLGLGLGEAGKNIAQHDELTWMGRLQPVRSDEWSVITPLAIAQKAHLPSFPHINHNLGSDGQNMLVIGMTGVPVTHVSAIAKPATWGFFIFDLRRALAWYWWLPFFSCFLAVWLLLLRLFSINWRLAAGLAITVAASPYSVVFSGWPAYAVFFPSIGLLAADSALRTYRLRNGIMWGSILGLAIAGFALVLYPAWLISLAYLFVPIALAHFVSKRRVLHFRAPQVVALIAALLVSSFVLIQWWIDAHDAIESIRSTVYPGQRSVEVGGDIDRWFLVKGWLSPMTMYHNSSLMVGASDAGSVVLLLIPLLIAVPLLWLAQRRMNAVATVLSIYIAIVLWFLFIGFDKRLASWTFWGSTTSYRFDLALGLAQVLLFGYLAADKSPSPHPKSSLSVTPTPPYIALVVAGLAVSTALFTYRLIPPAIIESVPPSYLLLSLLAMGASGFFLVRGNYTASFGIYGSIMLTAALPFNPVSLAPAAITPSPTFTEFASSTSNRGPDLNRVAVVAERNWAMLLPMLGIPVANTVFYYPQKTLWHKLDPQGSQRTLYNRYQRVLFELAPLEPELTYRIDSPRLDEVRVTLDPQRFNFDLLDAQMVLVNPQNRDALIGNPSLTISHTDTEWVLFRVIRLEYPR